MIKEEEEYEESEIKKAHDRMSVLENMIVLEREDRIQSLETQLIPIRQDLVDI